jgi:transposase
MNHATLSAFFERMVPARLVIEVGGQSAWVSHLAAECGLEVIVANARKVALITHNERKCDRVDGELLARLGRVDPALLSPLTHRSQACQSDKAVLSARGVLVASRAALVSHVRGVLKSFGIRVPSCSVECFPERARKCIPVHLESCLLAVLRTIDQVTDEVRALDKAIDQLADERYPVTRLLRQVGGVGPLVSLRFILTLEDAGRIKSSRQVGAYLGLTPRTRSSGESDPQLRITKAGDHEMRRLLVLSANYILGRFGPDCDLRRFGLKIAERGGKNARKRAKVAVARKLAVLMHRLWKTGEVYDPLHLAKTRGELLPA